MARHSTLVKAQNPFQKEGEADGENLQPGYLVEATGLTDDNKDTVATPGEAGNPGFKVVVDKYDVEIGGTYASGEQVFFNSGKPGEEYYVQCDGSDTIAVGDFLEKTTSGTLKDTDTGEKVARAKGSLDGTSGKIKVEVL